MAMKKSVKILLIMLMLIGLATCASLRGAPPPDVANPGRD